MVSRVPTFSFKRVRVKREHVGLVLLGVGILAAGMLSQPWYTLAAVELVYLGSIPFAMRAHDRLKRGEAKPAAAPAARKSVVSGKSVSVRVEPGGHGIIKNKINESIII